MQKKNSVLILALFTVFLLSIVFIYKNMDGRLVHEESRVKSEVKDVPKNRQIPKNASKTSDENSITNRIHQKTLADKQLEDLVMDEIGDLHKGVGVSWDNYSEGLSLPADNLDSTKFFNQIPINGNLSKEQQEQLSNMFVKLVETYGNEDPLKWIAYLRGSGETVSKERIRLTRQLLIEYGNMEPEELASDGWGLLEQVVKTFKKKSHWIALSDEQCKIDTFEVKAGEDIPVVGAFFQGLRNYQFSMQPWTTPPISAPQALEKNGKVLAADITIYVEHSGDGGGHIQPYVIRSWYDQENKIWRPFVLTYFPDKDQGFNRDLSTIFY